MSNLKTFYGVWTTDDEMHNSFKAYAQTWELAIEELKKHHDFYCSKSPEPDERHIVPMQMITEEDDSNKRDYVSERALDSNFIRREHDESITIH